MRFATPALPFDICPSVLLDITQGPTLPSRVGIQRDQGEMRRWVGSIREVWLWPLVLLFSVLLLLVLDCFIGCKPPRSALRWASIQMP